MDEYGFPFQRIHPLICYSPNQQKSCENGGIYYDSQCYCSGNYVGLRCEIPYCQNGVLSDTQRSCNCARGWTGTFCELGVCDIQPPKKARPPPSTSSLNKTLIVILDGSWTGNNADLLKKYLGFFSWIPYISTSNFSLNTVLTSVINSAKTNDTGWFTNFVGIVAYDSLRTDGNPISRRMGSTNSDMFIASMTVCRSFSFSSKL